MRQSKRSPKKRNPYISERTAQRRSSGVVRPEAANQPAVRSDRGKTVSYGERGFPTVRTERIHPHPYGREAEAHHLPNRFMPGGTWGGPCRGGRCAPQRFDRDEADERYEADNPVDEQDLRDAPDACARCQACEQCGQCCCLTIETPESHGAYHTGNLPLACGTGPANERIQVCLNGYCTIISIDRDGRWSIPLAPCALAPGNNVFTACIEDDWCGVTAKAVWFQYRRVPVGRPRLALEVVNADQTPAVGAEVLIRLLNGRYRTRMTTGQNGRVRVRTLMPGEYAVKAVGTAGGGQAAGFVQVAEGAANHLKLALSAQSGAPDSPHWICGRVTDASDGRPIAQAMVYAGEIGVSTADDGTFVLLGTPEHPIDLVADATGYQSIQEKEIPPSVYGTMVNLSLSPA